MRFDLPSFLIGFVSAAVIGLVLYRFRAQIVGVRRSAATGAGSTRRFLSNSAETRYFDEIVKVANRYHIAGDKVSLSDVYVEPRFISAITPVDMDDTNQVGSIFHVVPLIHDLPALYSAYNINTLSISDLQTGDRHLALLGVAGSGKSSALAIMALYARSAITLESLENMAEQVQLEEDKDLSETERAERRKRRHDDEERALSQLRTTQTRTAEANERLNLSARTAVNFSQLMPILVHLRDIDLSPEGYGSSGGGADKVIDPAEPLVRAVTRRFSAIAASTVPRVVYHRLSVGGCLVLLDGFDELNPAQQSEKLTWLAQFKALYGENVIVVAGPIEGYDALLNAGFTPLVVRPWSENEFERLITRWADAWPTIAGSARRPAPMPDDKLLKRTRSGNRGRTPLDVTLKTWAAFTGDEQVAGRRGGYDFYVRAQLDDADKQRPLFAAIAAAVLDNGGGLINKDQVKEVITPLLSDANGKPTTNISELADRLLARSGLLTDAPNNAYLFRHPLLTGFLAAESLITAPSERIAAAARQPAWEMALPFAAAHTALDLAVRERLSAPPDLLYSGLFDVARWISDAPGEVPWRGEVLKRLSAALLYTAQYPALRDRAAAALVTARDQGVQAVFLQTLRHVDPHIRRLGCIGLGAAGDPEAMKDIEPLLTDSDADVRLAAGMALGALHSDAALSAIRNSLYSADDTLRRAIAEALAAVPNDGHEMLREALQSPDGATRRAAVFGLARVKAPWALALLYHTMTDDSNWMVRSGAQDGFDAADRHTGVAPSAHPTVQSLPWLIEWAAQRGEGVPNNAGAYDVLIRVLQEGDTLHRATAALTLAYLGYVPGLKPLYTALRDRDEIVRGSAYEALAALQARLGQPLPAV